MWMRVLSHIWGNSRSLHENVKHLLICGSVLMRSTTGAETPECLFGFLKAHRKLRWSSLMMGTAGPLPHTHTHTHTLLPISKDVLFMRANLVWTMPHWYSTQCLLSTSRDPGPLWASIYLIPFPERADTCWWWGYGVTIVILAVWSYQ